MATSRSKPKKAQYRAESEEIVPFWDVDEDLKPYGKDKQARAAALRRYTAIIKFLADHGMFKDKKPAANDKGELVRRQVWGRDLTDEGVQFVRSAAKPWFSSKSSGGDPPKATILEEHLARVRGK